MAQDAKRFVEDERVIILPPLEKMRQRQHVRWPYYHRPPGYPEPQLIAGGAEVLALLVVSAALTFGVCLIARDMMGW
jgi:hypothetical protein